MSGCFHCGGTCPYCGNDPGGRAKIEAIETAARADRVQLRADYERAVRNLADSLDAQTKLRLEAEARADALRKALSALVHSVEDSGLHRVSCICAGCDTDDLPEGAMCECFDPAMEEALSALAIRRAAEGEGK